MSARLAHSIRSDPVLARFAADSEHRRTTFRMVLLRAVAHLCAITSIAAMIGTLYHIASHTRTGVVQPSGPGTYYTQLVTFASHLASSHRKHTYLPPPMSVVGLADVGAMPGQENVGGPRLRHVLRH